MVPEPSLPGSRWWRFGDPSLHHFWLIHPCDGQTVRQNCNGLDVLKAVAAFVRKNSKNQIKTKCAQKMIKRISRYETCAMETSSKPPFCCKTCTKGSPKMCMAPHCPVS